MENIATPFTSKGHSYLASTCSGLLQPQGWPPTPLSCNRISLDFSSIWAQLSWCALQGYVPSYRR